MNIVKTITDINGNQIYITQDELDQEKAMQAWKEKRMEETRRNFLRRYPTGRVA